MAKILTLDDDDKIRNLIDTVLTKRGHHVVTARTGSEGLEVFRREHPLLTILDLELPDMNGLSILQQIRAQDPAVPVIILTGADTTVFSQDAHTLGATEVVQKGLSLHTIGDIVDRLLDSAHTTRAATHTDGSNQRAGAKIERRLSPRLPVQLYAALSKDGIILGDAELTDLSRTGCALRTLVSVKQGDYLVLEMINPLARAEDNACVPFVCDLAVVRWNRAPNCGLEFIKMSQAHKDRLDQYMKAFQNQC